MENFETRGGRPTSSNAGRRRKFSEFAQGAVVQVDQLDRPLYTIPAPLDRPSSCFNIPHEPLTEDDLPRRRLLAGHQMVQTITVGPVVIAVISMEMCRSVLREATRADRHAFANRDHVRQTCTAAVQSRNAAKRGLANITGHCPFLLRNDVAWALHPLLPLHNAKVQVTSLMSLVVVSNQKPSRISMTSASSESNRYQCGDDSSILYSRCTFPALFCQIIRKF